MKRVRRGQRRAATQERVEHNVIRVGERVDEELDQSSGKRRGVRSLTALRLNFDYVTGVRRRRSGHPCCSRCAGDLPASCILPLSAAAPRGPVPNRPLPEVDFGLWANSESSPRTRGHYLGRNLICCWRQKWNTGSSVLESITQPPGTPCPSCANRTHPQTASPLLRCAITRSFTYRSRSPSSACSLMLRK